MTKSIVDLIHEAKAYALYTTHSVVIERLLTLHHATILQELTGEMPEPAIIFKFDGWTNTWEGSTLKECNKKAEEDKIIGYTADQMREYAAGLVVKAVAAEREQCAKVCESGWGLPSGDEAATAIRARGNV